MLGEGITGRAIAARLASAPAKSLLANANRLIFHASKRDYLEDNGVANCGFGDGDIRSREAPAADSVSGRACYVRMPGSIQPMSASPTGGTSGDGDASHTRQCAANAGGVVARPVILAGGRARASALVGGAGGRRPRHRMLLRRSGPRPARPGRGRVPGPVPLHRGRPGRGPTVYREAGVRTAWVARVRASRRGLLHVDRGRESGS
jgi:hypothetical protein